MDTKPEIVIVGGNGKTGRRIASRLVEAGHAVRAASRTTPIAFDWSKPRTWQEAVGEASALYLSYQPELALPGAAEQVRGVCQVAAERGVRRLVLLSGRGETQTQVAEDAVHRSGLESTVLQCSFFCQNFSEGLLCPQSGTVAFPAGKVLEPFVDCDDIAEVAVAALTEEGHAGKTYDLTGPRALSFAQATQTIARASGQAIHYKEISFETYGEMLAKQVPPPQARRFVELFRFLLDGHNSNPTQQVAQILGRPAKSFEDYAREAAPTWR